MRERRCIPRILIVDDLFGRKTPDGHNRDRANLCGQYLLSDITGDGEGEGRRQRVKAPTAEAVFCRGQIPCCAKVGDVVENDLDGTLDLVREGWDEWKPDRPRWAMVLLDLCFHTGRVTEQSHAENPGMPEGRAGEDSPNNYFGLQLLKAIHSEFPDLPVIILSGQSRQEVSLEFTQNGALAFLPRVGEASPDLLKDYLWRHALIPDTGDGIVGFSKPLLLALRMARRAAMDRRNILIRGERGTGKELFARYIHEHSPEDRQRPYQVVNSGGLSPDLYASELFGHRRGAYTGAHDDRVGRIVQANGGDLFLDEVGNMPYVIQNGLLRVLDQREVQRLGENSSTHVDTRFLSATNENIEGKAATGGFRGDLLDRLREGGTVYLPPLRERLEDLRWLVEAFLEDAQRQRPDAMVRDIDSGVFDRLQEYDWPGNVRELQSCIFKAVSDFPDVEHLVASHLAIPRTHGPVQPAPEATPILSVPPVRQGALEKVISLMERVDLESISSADLMGRLPRLQRAEGRLVAQVLKAALLATRKPTPDHPEGELLVSPAIKLITGKKDISTSSAADLIKRLLRVCPEIEDELLRDPILKASHDIALSLRPRSGQQKKQ